MTPTVFAPVFLNKAEQAALNAAVFEARRFISAAEALFPVLSEPSSRKRSAAIRASLDLSVSLAAFRRSRT